MDENTKKVYNNDAFAISGNRVDIESTNEPEPLVRATGFSSKYSETETPSRVIINQLFCELYSAAKETLQGISQWQSDIDYPANSFVQINGTIYHCLIANRNINPSSNVQTTWRIVGTRGGDVRSRPGTPGNLSIDGERADKIRVWWEITDNGGSPITNTSIRVSKDSSFPSTSATQIYNNQSQGATITITDQDSDAYYVSIRQQNTYGWSDWSAGVKVRSSPLSTGPVNTLQGSKGGSNAVVLKWLPPTLNGLSVSNYIIQWKSSTENYSTTERTSTVGGSVNSVTISDGLRNTREYTFKVSATSNRSTTNDQGNEVSVTPTSDTNAPTGQKINAYVVSPNQIDVVSFGGNQGSSAIQSYRFQLKLEDSDWDDDTVVSKNTTTAHTSFTNLTANTTYDLRVQASNGIWGSWSSVVEKTTTKYNAPSDIVASVNSGGEGKAVVSLAKDINDGGSQITGIQWQYKLTTNDLWTNVDSSLNPTQLISNLESNKTYQFRVKVTNAIDTTNSIPVSHTISSINKGPPITVYKPKSIDISYFDTSEVHKAFIVDYRYNSNGSAVNSIKWYIRRAASSSNSPGNWINTDDIWQSTGITNIRNFIRNPSGLLLVKNISKFSHRYSNGSYVFGTSSLSTTFYNIDLKYTLTNTSGTSDSIILLNAYTLAY